MSSSFKSPGETAKAVASIGGSKNNLSIASLAILGFLAGAYIAFGGMLAEICNAGMAAAGFPPGICKFVFVKLNKYILLLHKLHSTEMDFRRRSARITRREKIRNTVIREKN